MKQHPRTFKNPAVLHTMLLLRQEGWPLKELAFIFECNHTSIRKACLQNGLPPTISILPKPYLTFRKVIINEWGERINTGKTYKEYLEEKKPIKRQTVF